MHSMRRLRGYLLTGLTWAITWSVVGVLLSPLFPAAIGAESKEYLRGLVICAVGGGLYGFMAGTIFAACIMSYSRRHTLERLTVSKVSRWSMIGSLLFTLPSVGVMLALRSVSWSLNTMTFVFGGALLCVGSALGTLLMARRGTQIDRSRSPFELAAAQSAAAREIDPIVRATAQK